MLKDDIERVLISEETLQKRVAELGAQISADYAGKEPVLVSVLRGSYIFMADLTRHIDAFCRVDFMAVSSYGAGTVSSGQVNIIKDLSDSIEGKDVIVVEDILDSGNTLHYLFQLLQARHPASIKLATLLDKPSRRTKPITADYVGFEVPDEFVVGYGLDYDELYRNLPYIGVLKPRVYGENLISD
ncbi:MAG: hypoxanthine phosphoribosyltransferase [Oscillospiraceae bacterium]|jgi:hypoxanthine phosphoribosyltransferase